MDNNCCTLKVHCKRYYHVLCMNTASNEPTQYD